MKGNLLYTIDNLNSTVEQTLDMSMQFVKALYNDVVTLAHKEVAKR